MSNKDSFSEIISGDYKHEEEVLLPIMSDARIGVAVLAECVPEMRLEVDVDASLKEVAQDLGLDEGLVREAFERAKGKFEREQRHGY